MSRHIARLLIAAAVALATGAAVACGGKGGDYQATGTSTQKVASTAAATSTVGATPLATDSLIPPSEAGTAPVFYRTTDGFASMRAGEGYKVLFRITNGYTAATLRVTAKPASGGKTLEFEANLAQPGGTEAAGSYYPLTLDVPLPGRWTLTVFAGVDSATIPIDVAPAGAGPTS